MKNHRIIWDTNQWTVQRLIPSHTCTVGKYKGNTVPDKWVSVGHHTRLKYAVESMVDKALKAALDREGQESVSVEDLPMIVASMESLFLEARKDVDEMGKEIARLSGLKGPDGVSVG